VLINPCDELPDIKAAAPKVLKVFSDVEIEALYGLPIIDAAPLAVLIETGLRKDEMSRLILRDCKPETGRVIVWKGKGDKSRVVPMSPLVQQMLADLVLLERLNPEDHILYAVKGNQTGIKKILRDRHIGAATFARWWARCLGDAGVDYRPRFTNGPDDRGLNNPHITRHTCATRWRQNGLAMDEIQKLLGHSSISTTESLYVHTSVIDLERRMREIGLAV
jgi:integrase